MQGLIKYRYSMMALKAMDYSAVGLGENEIGLPLFHTLGEYALQYPRPRVLAANLINKNDDFPGDTKDYADHKPSLVGDWQLEAQGGLKVGIIGLVGPSVARQTHNQSVKFADNNSILPAVLKDLNTNGKPDVRVLLYQGTMDEGKACAQKYPDFQVILCLSEEDEPSAEPKRVGNTFVIGVGHKGKYVGVVGVNRPAKADQPFDLRYQLMALDPEFETPANQVQNHPVMKLMEEYTKELKKEQYLQRFVLGNHPLQVAYPGSAYVGSEACQKCHDNEHAIWKASPHAHAYKQLVNAKNPSLREFDGECVVCHVVGFGYKTGFTGKEMHLVNVGCESCHGPSSLHVADPKNVPLREALSPWRRQPGEPNDNKRIARIDQFCQKCHDIENDNGWKDFKNKWEKGPNPVDHLSKHPFEAPLLPKAGSERTP